ncbi:carbon-nitrogen hydrolase family protein [Cysteiniphilum sp. JM-1]|uniref:carbon-nitrogen hydrolase family protein n=1 Tax=Cysteiniphilum sp. JM-1 TaxID=2610891 RepID=UPI001246FB19|nr:nitrilase-related carbon-nitrogen hydrolase [Cysteiniphilum sp. JM-1]
MMTKIAIAQINACMAVGVNLLCLKRMIERAADSGAKLIIFPDRCALFSMNSSDYEINKEILGEGRIQDYLQKLSRDNNIWIIASGIPIVSEYSKEKYYLASVVYNSAGDLYEVYYHLAPTLPCAFQWTHSLLQDQEYGEMVKVIKTPFANIGLISTYDLFLPEVFRYLKKQGADIFAVSAAFTQDMGAHAWMTLLRARALENSSMILAANQSGIHEDANLLFHGNSMVVDHNGQLAQRIEMGEQLLYAEIDTKYFKNICFDQNPFQLQYRR